MNGDAEDRDEKLVVRTERSGTADAGACLVLQPTVVLLIDAVESVRLMSENEAATVHRWTEFVRFASSEILPRHQGSQVKSLGDGLLARFDTVRNAVNAAGEMHRTLAARNAGFPEDEHYRLRAGVNAAGAGGGGGGGGGAGGGRAARRAARAGPGETIASASAHEQLAAGLAGLANPGETFGSAAACDELTHGVDAVCEARIRPSSRGAIIWHRCSPALP